MSGSRRKTIGSTNIDVKHTSIGIKFDLNLGTVYNKIVSGE